MTVNVARRTRRRTPTSTTPSTPSTPEPEPIYVPVDSIAIGELEQTVFDCPNCRRPLALGARRCPGCRTMLLNGVVITKASTFIAAGLALGLLVGGAGGFVLGTGGSSNGVTPPVVPIATGSPAASTPATAPASVPPSQAPVSDIPPVTRSALAGAITTNDRLAAAGAELEAALAAPTFHATDVAQILRTMSADTVFGEQVAVHVSEWSGTSAVGKQLADFYAAVHETAATGLAASVRNEDAYRSAAQTMLRLLDQVDDLETAIRDAAMSAGVTLPN